MIMKYFDVTYKVAKQYEIILKDKQLRQIKAWYETKKGDGTISAESESVLTEILNKGNIMKKILEIAFVSMLFLAFPSESSVFNQGCR